MTNPIQGIIRGEAIVDGDASGGIDVILYAVTPGWNAIEAIVAATDPGGNDIIYATGGNPFKSGMVSKEIIFVGVGSYHIIEVNGPNGIKIDQVILLEDDTPITIAAQESLQAVELDTDDVLEVTDVFISQEKDSEYALVQNTDTPGQRIVKGRLLEMGSINKQFTTPFICTVGGGLKYFGHDTGLNVCLIHGRLT